MKISAFQKLTLIDYPGNLAATVFLSGCNFYCPWCYSSELVLPQKIRKMPKIPERELFNFLKERKGFLEGVVICGGEPTIHQSLPQFCQKIKKLGYKIKLDSNGSNPKMIKKLINSNLIDYLALDVKLPKEKYREIFGQRVKIRDIEKSLKFLKEGKIDYEFRTTIVPKIHKKEDILKIAQWIAPAKRYFLQNFRPEKTIDPEFEKIKPYPKEFLLDIQKAISPLFDLCQVR